MTAPRERRDCEHVRVRHRHGTRAAYTQDRCRCVACTAANARAEAARTRDAVCRRPRLVDAAPVREHVRRLTAGSGVGLRRLARSSGVPYPTLLTLLYGNRRTGKPTQRINAIAAAALLAFRAGQLPAPEGALVPAIGTRRRLQALATLGWTTGLLADVLGADRRDVRRWLTTAGHVTARTARRVDVAYERLWDRRPQPRTDREQATIIRTRQAAAAAGWRPPLAWDDIDTDPEPRHIADSTDGADDEDWDEVLLERAMTGERLPLTVAERNEVVRRLTDRGLSLRDIADRLGISTRTITRARGASRAA